MKRLYGLAILIVSAVALVACKYSLQPQERDSAELGGLKYATAAGKKFIACSGEDSNSDGYVTCSMQDASGITEMLCSYKSPGCKLK